MIEASSHLTPFALAGPLAPPGDPAIFQELSLCASPGTNLRATCPNGLSLPPANVRISTLFPETSHEPSGPHQQTGTRMDSYKTEMPLAAE